MKSLLEKLRAYHQAFWTFDPWYRRAWMAGPMLLAATVLGFVLVPAHGGSGHAGAGPSGAPWAKAAAGAPAEQANPDQKLCVDAAAAVAQRLAACDRQISAGKLSGNALAEAYFARGWARASNKDVTGAIADYSEAIKINPEHKWAANNRGNSRLDRNELDLALKDFEEAIRLNPGQALPLANKAESLRRLGRLADAQAEVKKALDADRTNARAKAIQDLILADLKKMEAAQQAGPDLAACRTTGGDVSVRGAACDRLIKRGGMPPDILSDAYFGRAWMRENTKDIAGAIVDYSETIRLSPQSSVAFNNRGGLLLQRGELGDAMRDFDEAIRITPRYAQAIANRAEVLRLQDKLPEAQAEIKQALDIDGNNARAKFVQGLITADVQKKQVVPKPEQPKPEQKPQPQPDQTTEVLRKRARGHLQGKDYDSAIADFTDVIRREGATWEDYNQRGIAYMSKGQNPQALADFDRAVSRAGHGPEAHYNRALIHERTGSLPKAQQDLEAALRDHSASDPDYFLVLGRIYTNQSNHDRAVLTYDSLINLYDKDKAAKPNQKAYAFYLRARAKKSQVMAERSRCPAMIPPSPDCMSGMRFAGAILDLETALVFSPNYSSAHFEKGLIAAEIGNTKSAIEAYTAAIKADPTNSMAYNNRGVQYAKQNETQLAFGDYNDAIRHDPSNKYAWANRGVLYTNARQRNKGIEDIRKALEIDPSYAYALRQLQILGVRR